MNDNNIISLSSLFESNDENNNLEEDFEMIEIEDEPPKQSQEIISLDDIINKEELLVNKSIKKKDYDKIIERIQISLIIFLILASTLIYFFGYNFFEPYIKID